MKTYEKLKKSQVSSRLGLFLALGCAEESVESEDELSERQSESEELELISSEPEETCPKHHHMHVSALLFDV